MRHDALLLASFPSGPSQWFARRKDHAGSAKGGADRASITVCAIALNDPTNQWVVQIVSHGSAPASGRNEATAGLPEGYVMTGGGAELPEDGIGQLLYGSYPSGTRAWTARSTDKYISRSLPLTAYVIGIKPRNGAPLPELRVFPGLGGKGSGSAGTASVDAGWLLVGGGAFAEFGGGGNLLSASIPATSNAGWEAASHDQEMPSPWR